MNFSDYLEQQLLGATLLGSTFTSPSTLYFALGTAITTTGSEVNFTEVASGLGYERKLVEFSEPTSGPDWSCVNSATLTFSPATTPWGAIVAGAVFDSEAIGSGNLLYWGEPTSVRTIQTDDVFEVPSGNFYIRLD